MRREKTKLAPRERLVLLGLSQGKTRKQVASEMGISGNTLKQYLMRAYRFLGAVNLVDAVLKMRERES